MQYLFIFFTFTFYILHLYCPKEISLMGNSGCFPLGGPAATELCTQPVVHAVCFSVSIIH